MKIIPYRTILRNLLLRFRAAALARCDLRRANVITEFLFRAEEPTGKN